MAELIRLRVKYACHVTYKNLNYLVARHEPLIQKGRKVVKGMMCIGLNGCLFFTDRENKKR